MFDNKAIKESFGRAAKHYDEHAQLQQVVRKECISMAEVHWGDGICILDVGCGTGAFAQDVKELGHDWNITALDMSFGMCEVARAHNEFVINANSETLPFADGSFDGVFSSLMLQWANDPLAAMREMARVTRSGGSCVIATFTHETLHELREAFSSLDDAPHVNDFIDPHRLSALAVHAGFMLLTAEEETITEHYTDAVSLMRSLKSIGATSVRGKQRKGMMTPKQLQKLEDEYQKRFKKKNKKGLPATWQVMYMVLGKQ